MSTMNVNAPVFNYTKKYSTKLPLSNPFETDPGKESVACQEFGSVPKLPPTNLFQSIAEEKQATSQEAVRKDFDTKGSAYNAFSASEAVLKSPDAAECIPKRSAGQNMPRNPFAAQENVRTLAVIVEHDDELSESALNPFSAQEPVNNAFTAEELLPKPIVGKQKQNTLSLRELTNELAQCILTSDDKNNFEQPHFEQALHPLEHYWTLWYLENNAAKSWKDMQNEITTIGNVEDFWHLYNHIKPPSQLPIGSDYSFFKSGIRPMWEDEANIAGGRWVITLNKAVVADLDDIWLHVLLCLIGEAFDNTHEVCGAVVNVRYKVNKISIWTANGMNEDAVMEIGNKLRNHLRLGRQNLQYQLHKDTMLKQSSNVRPLYVL